MTRYMENYAAASFPEQIALVCFALLIFVAVPLATATLMWRDGHSKSVR